MTKKVYRTARGSVVDLGALQLKNENTRAVGNMGVNARGDRVDSNNRSIESRNVQVSKQYKRQNNVSDSPVVPSKSSVSRPIEKKVEDSTVVTEPEVSESDPGTPVKGLADAIAKARQIKQEPMKTPRQLAQERAGVKKI